MRYRQLDLIDQLLAAGADPRARAHGDTPACYALVGTGEQINIFSRLLVDDNVVREG